MHKPNALAKLGGWSGSLALNNITENVEGSWVRRMVLAPGGGSGWCLMERGSATD